MPVIDLSESEAYFEALGPALVKAARRGLVSAAERAKSIIVSQIIPARSPQPVDRGVYKAGWQTEATAEGADLYNAEPHAAFIEYGVRGGSVKIGGAMLAALAEWAERKGIAEKGRGMSAAWGIARSMQRRGIFNGGQGMGILAEVVDKHLPRIIEAEVAREIEREFGK